MALYQYTRQQLKPLKAMDFKQGDLIDVIDKQGDVVYTINIDYGKYSHPSLKTTVNDKNWNLLDCTAGVKGGWPYYIADFIRKREDE